MKTVKEIADMLGVSKTTVARYIKSVGATESAQDGQTFLYDDSVVTLVVEALSDKKSESTETGDIAVDFREEYILNLEETIVYLKKEIEDKNSQFETLQTILNQQQQLLLYEQQKNTKLLEENVDSKKWWQWWK
ncbi:hypothetical protein DOK76_00040 [Vagococcus sp. DIV0080]|uniref:Helix-turn-helix type 11 domain-containing protein n=1 Tax=Candidatus Vagococcus giribetii TaxID=2230876 RepID=A0ABS3HNV6_9ENTE|nr:hypothetical protein [Vagococcus sp. DIV0080]MBO0475434.1 hypothetical protein [Vagococcus sp. DIV0080]